MKNKKLFLCMSLIMTQASYASESSDEIALLRQQVKLLTQRLDQLEAANAQTTEKQAAIEKKVAEKSTDTKSSGNWSDKLSFNADIRDRFEYIDQKGKTTRTRNRVRFRFGGEMHVSDNLDIGFRLASGGEDPASTNQTLDGAFSTKGIQLDLAYFNYQFNDVFSLTGGKMKNPFYKPAKNQILWDGDLNPEGFSLNIENDFLNASLVGFSVEERSSADDTLLFGGQLTHDFKITDGTKLIVGLGYYDYQKLKGSTPLFDGKSHGNTLDSDGNIANDFNIIEAFLEYKTKLSSRPLSIYGNYYQNTQADDLDTAFTAGFTYGKVKDFGTWSVGYAYLDVEADAVYGLFNDSDFGGGNTDSKGHLLKAGFGLKKNMSLGLTYIDSEINQSKLLQTDYDRLQLDLKIKFK